MLSVKQTDIDTLRRERIRPHLNVKKEIYSHREYKRGRRYLTQVFLTSAPLVIGDLLASSGAFLFAVITHRWLNFSIEIELLSLLPYLSLTLLIVYFIFGLYPGSGLSPIFELRQITVSTTLVFIGFFAASLQLIEVIPWSLLFSVWLLAIITVPVMRFILRRTVSRFKWWGQPVLIFDGNKADVNYDYLASRPHFGLRPIGIVGNSKSYPYLGTFEMAPAIAKNYGIYWAVVALPEQSSTEVLQVIKTYIRHFPHVLFVTDFNELPSLWNRAFDFGRLHGICLESNLLLPLPRFAKRVVDLLISVSVGFFCLPLSLIIALLIKLTSPGPVLYGHERIGYNGRRFKAWKFRTMVTDGDALLKQYFQKYPELKQEWEKNQKLREDPRVTSIGSWLRKLSLDELPQLWNVLLGEMSAVGPRPIIEAEISRYGDSFGLYKRVVPGLTGLWQVSGRNNTTYTERVNLDSYYARNWSPWMDVYILARTVKVVLFPKGAY